jgi:hypothetical protein
MHRVGKAELADSQPVSSLVPLDLISHADLRVRVRRVLRNVDLEIYNILVRNQDVFAVFVVFV